MRGVFLIMMVFVLAIETRAQAAQEARFEVAGAKQFNRSFTLQPFSPTTGSLKFNYSQVMVKNLTINFGLGIIGPHTANVSLQSRGITAKSGVKMYFSPDYYTADMKKYSDFQGGYFEPELAISVFAYHNTFESREKQNFSSAILLNFGKQRVVGNQFLIEAWIGLGYCLNNNGDYGEPAYKYEFVAMQELGLAFTSGFAIGFLTK